MFREPKNNLFNIVTASNNSWINFRQREGSDSYQYKVNEKSNTGCHLIIEDDTEEAMLKYENPNENERMIEIQRAGADKPMLSVNTLQAVVQ